MWTLAVPRAFPLAQDIHNILQLSHGIEFMRNSNAVILCSLDELCDNIFATVTKDVTGPQ